MTQILVDIASKAGIPKPKGKAVANELVEQFGRRDARQVARLEGETLWPDPGWLIQVE